MLYLGILVRDRGALFVDLLIGTGKWERERAGSGTRNLTFSIFSAPPPPIVWHGKGSHFPSRGMAALI